MKRNPMDDPFVAIEFRLADGGAFRRSWSMNSPALSRVKDALSTIPDWLDNPMKSWPHPQDPITFSGDVKPGREEEARAFVAALEEVERDG